MKAHRGAPPDRKQAIVQVGVMRRPLAIAQQPPRDFLTAERSSVSVKGYGVPSHFVARSVHRTPKPGEPRGQRHHHIDDRLRH
jgi:hypothetical protein